MQDSIADRILVASSNEKGNATEGAFTGLVENQQEQNVSYSLDTWHSASVAALSLSGIIENSSEPDGSFGIFGGRTDGGVEDTVLCISNTPSSATEETLSSKESSDCVSSCSNHEATTTIRSDADTEEARDAQVTQGGPSMQHILTGAHELPNQDQDLEESEEELLAYLQDKSPLKEDVLDTLMPRNCIPDLPPTQCLQGPGIAESGTHANPSPQLSVEAATRKGYTPCLNLRRHDTAPAVMRSKNTQNPKLDPLDRIDKLDKTFMGQAYHHSGPFDLRAKFVELPPRIPPIPRSESAVLARRYLFSDAPPHMPPSPVPFKIDLKPGEYLIRVPLSLSISEMQPFLPQQGLCDQRPVYPALQCAQQTPDQLGQPTARREWSSTQLDNGPSGVLNGATHHNRNERQDRVYDLAMARTKQAHIHPNGQPVTNVEHESAALPRHERRVVFQKPLSDMPFQRPGLGGPIYSSDLRFNSNASIQGHPSMRRFLPRKIILPAPLQLGQSQQHLGDSNFSNWTQAATAATIHVHDPKKGSNLLRKPSAPASSLRKSLSLNSRTLSGNGLADMQDIASKTSKPSRKLSKRRNPI